MKSILFLLSLLPPPLTSALPYHYNLTVPVPYNFTLPIPIHPPTLQNTTKLGSCGPLSGRCARGFCCSKHGYCGSNSSYCGQGCQASYGSCGTNASMTTGSRFSYQPIGAGSGTSTSASVDNSNSITSIAEGADGAAGLFTGNPVAQATTSSASSSMTSSTDGIGISPSLSISSITGTDTMFDPISSMTSGSATQPTNAACAATTTTTTKTTTTTRTSQSGTTIQMPLSSFV